MAVELRDLEQMLEWIKACDRALDGKEPPEWLRRLMMQSARQAVINKRAELVARLRHIGVPIVDDEV